MMKVIIQEKFNTSMGLVFRVKQDQLFRVHQVVSFETGDYRIDAILYGPNAQDDCVYLVVSKV